MPTAHGSTVIKATLLALLSLAALACVVPPCEESEVHYNGFDDDCDPATPDDDLDGDGFDLVDARTLAPTVGPVSLEPANYGGFARAEPCDFAAGSAPTEPLTCGLYMVLDAADGGPLPSDANHCEYPADDYQLLQTAGGIVIKLEMCTGGRVVVFDGNACYGAASFGSEWAVFPLPTHTIGVTGGKYLVTTEDC